MTTRDECISRIKDRRSLGVADAFNIMANALEDREHELYDAKENAEQAAARITTIFESTADCVLIVDQTGASLI